MIRSRLLINFAALCLVTFYLGIFPLSFVLGVEEAFEDGINAGHSHFSESVDTGFELFEGPGPIGNFNDSPTKYPFSLFHDHMERQYDHLPFSPKFDLEEQDPKGSFLTRPPPFGYESPHSNLLRLPRGLLDSPATTPVMDEMEMSIPLSSTLPQPKPKVAAVRQPAKVRKPKMTRPIRLDLGPSIGTPPKPNKNKRKLAPSHSSQTGVQKRTNKAKRMQKPVPTTGDSSLVEDSTPLTPMLTKSTKLPASVKKGKKKTMPLNRKRRQPRCGRALDKILDTLSEESELKIHPTKRLQRNHRKIGTKMDKKPLCKKYFSKFVAEPQPEIAQVIAHIKSEKNDVSGVPSSLKGSDYELVKILQHSKQAEVSMVRDTSNGRLAVMKVFLDRPIGRRHVPSESDELDILQTISPSPFIIGLIGPVSDHKNNRGESAILLEKADMNLDEFINRGFVDGTGVPLTESQIAIIAEIVFCILNGLLVLKEKALIHGDLKSENVLIFLASPVKAKLADFGLTISPIFAQKPSTIYTVDHRPPEIFKKQVAGYASDMWALGIIIVTMCLGYNPLLNLRKEAMPADSVIAERVRDNLAVNVPLPPVSYLSSSRTEAMALRHRWTKLPPYLETLRAVVPPLLLDLVLRMVQEDPKNRISAEAALYHPFILNRRRLTEDDLPL